MFLRCLLIPNRVYFFVGDIRKRHVDDDKIKFMAFVTDYLHIDPPVLEVNGQTCTLKGDWVVAAAQNPRQLRKLSQELERSTQQALQWDLRAIRLDHIWAQTIWRCWNNQMPKQILLTDEQSDLFERIGKYTPEPDKFALQAKSNGVFANIGFASFGLFEHLIGFVQLIGQFVLDLLRVLKAPRKAPWKDFSGQIIRMGAQALPITGLVGLLIGVVIVYLLGGFLIREGFGEVIVGLVGVASIRELGPLLAAILIAGRSGSTITAQIGVMRLREELDAMHVLGISTTFRLVLPRVMALGLSMPFIAMWTSFMIILGGMIVADLYMGISRHTFLHVLPLSVSMGNIWINIGKSVVFGMLIALVGSHFGMRVKADTDSLGNGTTASVVASITAVILADAMFAILCRNVPV